MDLNFFRRGRTGFAGSAPARLDYGMLVATLAAIQSATATARAEHRCAVAGLPARRDALLDLILGGSGWREAIALQGGSFNPGAAMRLRKAA
jgi:hypothetical protein